MLVYTNNILLLPVLLAAWLVNGFLFLATARFILLNTVGAGRFTHALAQLTDPVPDAVEKWLTRKHGRPPQRWVTWLILTAALLIVQHMLTMLTLGK